MCYTIYQMKFRLDNKRQKRKPGKVATALAPWRLQLVVGISLTIIVGILLTATWYISHVPYWQITTVKAVGGSTIAPRKVEQAAEEVLSDSYFQLVPHSFIPFYPAATIKGRVLALARVHHVSLKRSGQTLTIHFDEYQPAALWCASRAAHTCVFMSADGYAFAEAPKLTGDAFVRYINGTSTPKVNVQGFSPVYINDAQQFITGIQHDLGLTVVAVVRQDELDTSYFLSTGGELKVSNKQSLQETLTNLHSILTSEDFADVADGSFFYIDLRFGNKVYVSKTDPAAVVASSTALTNEPPIHIEMTASTTASST